eukprot:1192600-Prorocentrum_minimum.AAC.1
MRPCESTSSALGATPVSAATTPVVRGTPPTPPGASALSAVTPISPATKKLEVTTLAVYGYDTAEGVPSTSAAAPALTHTFTTPAPTGITVPRKITCGGGSIR